MADLHVKADLQLKTVDAARAHELAQAIRDTLTLQGWTDELDAWDVEVFQSVPEPETAP